MLSIYQYFGYDLPLKERFKLIKEAGFDFVGLWRDDWFGWSEHREYADIARNAGLNVADGHAPTKRDNYNFVDSIWLDNLNGETTVDVYFRTIKACGEDGVANLIVHLEDSHNPPPPNELGIERIKRLLEVAENYGVAIALENITYSGYLSYVFERVKSPKLGFCYDAGHRNCDEPDVDILSKFGDKLIALHLHDNDGSGDQHLMPFTGNVNWAEQMSAIAAAGYNGAVTLECATGGPGSANSDATRSAEEWLRDAFNAAQRLDALRKA
jgi:sugar phosphate isomerase/epimerase